MLADMIQVSAAKANGSGKPKKKGKVINNVYED